MKKLFFITLFTFLFVGYGRYAATTTPQKDSAPQKTKSMSNRPDLYAFTQVTPADSANDTDSVVLIQGLFQTMSQASVVVRKLQILTTPSGTGDSSQAVSGYLLLVNHHPIQYLESSSCDKFKDCDGKGEVTSASYTFNDIDCIVKQDTIIHIEVRAKFRDKNNTGNSLTVQLVWLDVEKIFRDPSGHFITEEGKRL